MKKAMVWVVLVAGIAGVAGAGQLKGMAAWAVKTGSTGVEERLSASGLSNAADRAAVSAAWDEATLIETCLSNGAYNVVLLALQQGGVSTAGMARIKASILAEDPLPAALVGIVMKFPVSERGDFAGVLDAGIPAQYAATPAYWPLYLKYAVFGGVRFPSPDIPEGEVVPVLLAGEPLDLNTMRGFKESLKERALRLARVKLRADGKSFVVKDGVNPLATMAQPVVDALNAPECAGLEAALRAIGGDVADQDRAPARALVSQWRGQVLSGEMATAQTMKALGKIAVMLGPEAYNQFVDSYNNGSAVGP